MESFAIHLSHMLVDAVRVAATEPATNRKRHIEVVVPDNHAVSDDWVNIHGVEERDLAHVDRQLLVLVWFFGA
jgi:hypothetical protein